MDTGEETEIQSEQLKGLSLQANILPRFHDPVLLGLLLTCVPYFYFIYLHTHCIEAAISEDSNDKHG